MHPSQNEILSLENKYWSAMRNNDVETAMSLTRFPCTLTGPKGVQSIEEDEYREMMSSMNGQIFQGVELQNPQVTVLNADAALISYNINIKGKNMLDTSTWVRENGKWICAVHTENPLSS